MDGHWNYRLILLAAGAVRDADRIVVVNVVNLAIASALLCWAGLTFVVVNVLVGITAPSVVRKAPWCRLKVVLTRWNISLWLVEDPLREGVRALLVVHSANPISVELMPGVG